METKEKEAHINGKYLILVAIITLLGTLATVYKDQLIGGNKAEDELQPSDSIPKIDESTLLKDSQKGDSKKEKDEGHISSPLYKSDTKNTMKIFYLTIIVNSDDKIVINGKPAIFFSNSANVKKVEILEGEKYEIIIGNCDPIIISKASKNETITRCS